VIEPWPKVAALPANQVTGEQVADMMRRVIELGKARTSNKLRSYVRAAYQTAKAARSKASIPVRFKGYNVTHNPGADTEPDESANRADKRPLTAEELRSYWQAIKTLPGQRGAVLRLHLLTGGQRIEQLVNLRTENVRDDSITLFDGKGRPGKPPRPHTVPLIPQAAAALLECQPPGHLCHKHRRRRDAPGRYHPERMGSGCRNHARLPSQAHSLGRGNDLGKRPHKPRDTGAAAKPRYQWRAKPPLRRAQLHG